MSEERVEILKMVADKVIAVDEAERLLRAMEDGAQRRTGQQEAPKGSGSWSQGFSALGEALSGIGSFVRDAVDVVVNGVDMGAGETDGLEPIDLIDGRLPVTAETELVILTGRKRIPWAPRGGDLDVSGTDGDQCEIAGDAGRPLEVFTGRDRIVIRSSDGDLRVRVPHVLRRLKVAGMGGQTVIRQVDAEISVKTVGGNLTMENLRRTFDATATGGNVHLSLDAGWQGASRATTVGGNITTVLPADLAIEVKAETVGGNVSADQRLVAPLVQAEGPCPKMTYRLGEVPSRASLALKSVGGNIQLQSSQA